MQTAISLRRRRPTDGREVRPHGARPVGARRAPPRGRVDGSPIDTPHAAIGGEGPTERPAA